MIPKAGRSVCITGGAFSRSKHLSGALRAVMSMARLWRDQGKRDEARELLAPVYGLFTEGFDTLDLKEAKALFGELNSENEFWNRLLRAVSAGGISHSRDRS